MASLCEDPDHVGSRVQYYDRTGLWQYRTTYYRNDGAQRKYEKTHRRVCTECMERREAGTRAPVQESLLLEGGS